MALFLAISLPATSCGNEAQGPIPVPLPVEQPPVPVGGDGAAGTISVSSETTFQTIDGFGTSMRLFDDPHLNGQTHTSSSGGILMTLAQQDTILDLLYNPVSGIGLNRLRLRIVEKGWQTSEGGSITSDAPYPGPQGPRKMEFIRRALERNPALKTGFQMGTFDDWITNATPALTVARYIKTSLDYSKSRGHEPDWAGVHNEPSNTLPQFSGENLRDISIELKRLLEADGYSTMLSAPDDINDNAGSAKAAVILASPAARATLKSLSIHLYDATRPVKMKALAETYRLPLWMTEYYDREGSREIGWASGIVHDMLVTYNISAVDMLFGFLTSRTEGNPAAGYITLNSSGSSYLGYTINPSYYQMGHWSKHVPRGSVRIGAASTSPAVKVSAFDVTGKKVIVLVHSGDAPASFAIPAGNYRMISTQMSGTDRLSDKGLFRSAVTLLARSVTTLVEQ